MVVERKLKKETNANSHKIYAW